MEWIAGKNILQQIERLVVVVAFFKTDCIVILGNNQKAMLLRQLKIVPLFDHLNRFLQFQLGLLWLVVLHEKNAHIDDSLRLKLNS